MVRTAVLTCLLAALPATVNARRATEPEPSSEEAPFAEGVKQEPAPFAASPSAGFAALGQWVLTLRTTGDGGFLFFHKDSPGDWSISLHPAIDYFITSSVSLGAVAGYFHSPALTGTTVLDLGARAGFNLNINDHVGLWPSAGLAVNYASADHQSNTTTTFGIFAPVLYHLVPHLFVGLGPSFSARLSGADGKSYGVDFVLGGWL